MPRVMHVIGGLEVGGAEMALYRLVTATTGGESTYTHAVVSLTPDGPMGQRLRDSGIELTTFDFRKAPLRHFFDLLTLLRRSRPDIVQTWMYHADMLGGLAARLSGIRNVIWGIRTSELTAGSSRATIAVRAACAWLSRWVPHTIVCVAEAARETHMHAGYEPGRMVVVPNGFDLSRLTASDEQISRMRAQCGFGTKHLVIGTLGRFNFSKDQQNFVRAAGELAQQHENVRFLMVGRNLDANNAELIRWIGQTGHADRFVLLGERADVPTCLGAMDIFCLSSRNEGFPNVVGEAMALARPCVVTDVGDAAMLVGDTGVVVPRENSTALARGMTRLVTMDTEARHRLGRCAQDRIRADFTTDKTRERFESIYRCLTEKNLV